MIIYEGPSVLDGKPIVVIATRKTKNRKTGDLVQIWILRADIDPLAASKAGEDESICGQCPRRWFLDGDCYVLLFQAPLAIYRAFKRGSYKPYQPGDLAGADIRLGAYGDPAAVPFAVWEGLELNGASAIIGYTHQRRHVNFDKRVGQYCQISADTPKEAARAQLAGYRTFRVTDDISDLAPSEQICPASTIGTTCAACQLCDGRSANIAIQAHGARSAKKLRLRLAA